MFTQLHNRLPALSRLCTTLGRLFSSRMQTNIYLTPPDAQGFNAHWDTHDVIVLQVAGSKRWTVYDTPIKLPLRGQEFDPDRHKAGEPTLEFELKAGDMAYIPRGAFHSARSTDEVSLHVTTGLIAFTWTDPFLQGVTAAAADDDTLRENLPFGFEDARISDDDKQRLLREKLDRFVTHLVARPPFDYFAGEVLARNRPCLTDLLSQVSRAGALTLASTLRRRPDATWDVRETDTTCVLRCYGNHIELPRFVSPALAFVLSRPRFRVSEVPDCIDGHGAPAPAEIPRAGRPAVRNDGRAARHPRSAALHAPRSLTLARANLVRRARLGAGVAVARGQGRTPNVKTVCERYSSPGLTIVEGK